MGIKNLRFTKKLKPQKSPFLVLKVFRKTQKFEFLDSHQSQRKVLPFSLIIVFIAML